MQRRIDIGHVGDDQRVVAAHLQRQHLLRLAAEIAMEMETGRRAASEQHAVDITIFQQRLASGFSALQQIDHPVRDARLLPQLDGHFGGGRRQLAGFKHDGIPGNQCRNDVPVGQVAREVVGTKDRHHAMRFVAQLCFSVRQRRLMKARPLVIGLDGDRGLADHRLYFGAGLPQRLAGLPGNQGRQRLFMCLQQRGKTLHHGNTLGQRPVRPGVKCRARRGAGRLDVVGTRAGRLPQQRLILRGQFAHRCPTARLPLPGYKLCFYRHDLFSSGFRVTV